MSNQTVMIKGLIRACHTLLIYSETYYIVYLINSSSKLMNE